MHHMSITERRVPPYLRSESREIWVAVRNNHKRVHTPTRSVYIDEVLVASIGSIVNLGTVLPVLSFRVCTIVGSLIGVILKSSLHTEILDLCRFAEFDSFAFLY